MPALPLKRFHILVLLCLIGCVVVFTITQKYYIPEPLRPFTLLLALVGICFIFYLVVRPDDEKGLAKFLSIVFGGCALVLIVVIDIILKHTYSYKFIIVLAAAFGSPFLAMVCYNAVRSKQKPTSQSRS